MPLYDLTSPASGQTYRVNFDGDPQDADIEEAVRSFDAEEFAARGGEGDPNAAMQQGPVGTTANAIPQSLGSSLFTVPLKGIAQGLDAATDYVSQVTGLKKGGFFADAAKDYENLQAETERTFPTNPFNPKAKTVGSGIGQGMGMLAGGVAAKALGATASTLTAAPLAIGAASGMGQGIDTAKEIGVQNPLDQLAMGLLYGGVEVLTEKLGGFGNQAATEALLAPIKKNAAQLLKQAAKTTLSESGEEVLAEGAQALITRAYADEDPARPGFTKTGVELPKLDRKLMDRMGLAALGGAAGGSVFAGVQTLADIQQPPALPADAQPTTAQRNRRPVEVVPAPPLSTLARIAAESVAPEGDTGAFTAEDVANLEAEGSAGTPARMDAAPESAQSSVLSAQTQRPLPQPILQNLGQPMSDPLPSNASVTKDSGPTADQAAQQAPGAGLSPATGSFSYNLTSPTTGQTYTVEFDREPQDTDIEEAVAALDAEASASAQTSESAPTSAEFQPLAVPSPTQEAPTAETAQPESPATGVRFKAAVKVLTTQGVDEQTAASLAPLLARFLPEGIDMEAFRDRVLSEFEAIGGKIPNAITKRYVEQAAAYEAQGYTPAEAATHAENARAANQEDVDAANAQNASMRQGLKNLNVNGTTAGFANAQILSEAADLIRNGITDFTNWSRAMLTRFGRGIQEYLAGVWQQVLKSLPNNAVQNVRMGRTQGTAPLSLANSGAVINPFTPSDAPGWMRTLFKMPTIGAFRVQNLKVRQLLTGSALPKAMAEIVTASTRDKQSIEYAAAALANDLEQAMKAHSQVTGQSEQQINNLVTDVLQGTVPLSIILNPTLRTAIRRARNLLDNLSTAVGNATGGTLGQTITANLGQWMRRSYAAFDPDAGWSFDALTEAAKKGKLVAGVSAAKILKDARNYLRTQTPGITNGELEAQMRQLMDRNLWEEALAGSGAGVRKDVTSLMKRKDIAPEILALMGEERNPVKKLLGSTKWQAQYIAKHDNQVKLRDLGLQLGMMSPTQTGRFTEAMGEDRSTSGFAVNGKSVYTTPELKAALNQTVGVIPTEDLGGSLIKLIYWLGGQAKLNKVALNPDSWLVNLMGNVTGLAMTGALSPFAPMRLFQNSRKAIELMRAGQKQSAAGTQAQVQNDLMRGMMAKLTAAGVADSSMNAALVEDALNKSLVQFIEKHDVWNGAVGAVKLAVIGQALAVPFGVTGRVVGGAVGGAAGYFIGNERVQNVQEAVAKWTMQNPDRFGKIVEFLDNHTTLLAAGMTPDQAFAKATAKTLNTMPDYSKLPPVLRQFSRLGVVGSFIAFQWEVYRNSFHNAKYIVEELGSGNRALMEKGARRLLGMSSVYALALGGLQALLGNDAGDDDKDEAYRRALGKPWEKFTRLAYTRLDTEKASFYNTSYLLPQVTLTNLIRAAMEGKDFPQAMEFVGSTLQNQFLESGIHADPLIALLFNIDRGGQKASTEEGWRATVERLAEVLAPMTPGAADKFERILRSKEVLNQPRWDREFSVEEEMKRLLGIRQSTYAHDRRIAGRLSEFNNRKRDIAASAAQVYGSTGKAKADVWGQQQQQEAAQRASERLATLKAEYDQFVIDLGTLGFTPYQIQRFRKDAGTSPNWRPYGITPDGIKQPVTR